MVTNTSPPAPRTQADRRARTRGALLEAAARGISRYGYANVALERVASEAGYTRGALYHLFANKEDLALAVVAWIDETWKAEVGDVARREADPVDALMSMAHGHIVYCRRDVARVLTTLRVEFAEQDHPVGRSVSAALVRLTAECTDLIERGRLLGSIPAGPPPRVTAGAYLATLEAVGIALAGRSPYDIELATRAVRGVLGLAPVTPSPGESAPS